MWRQRAAVRDAQRPTRLREPFGRPARPVRRGAPRSRHAPRGDVHPRRRPGTGLGRDLQPRAEGRVLASILPRLHPRGLRRPRHRQVRCARLPDRAHDRRLRERDPGRAFYTTREHAEDIESVRLALGVDKIAIWGVSYGTKHAEAYALAHPSHVERLLLDSVVLPDNNLVDPLSLRSIPGLGQRHLHQQRLSGDRARDGRQARRAREPARGAPGQRDGSFHAEARELPGDDRRRHARLARLRERPQLRDLVPAARCDQLRTCRRLPAAGAPGLDGRDLQRRRPGRREHRPAALDELRRRPVPLGAERPDGRAPRGAERRGRLSAAGRGRCVR